MNGKMHIIANDTAMSELQHHQKEQMMGSVFVTGCYLNLFVYGS